VLHFAPERVFQRIFRTIPQIEYTTVDLFQQSVDLRADITAIPIADKNVDVVLCNHVLEHVPNDRKAMAELYRILRPGGWGILMHPVREDMEHTYEDFAIVGPQERERAFGQHDHVRLYGRDFLDRLRSVGFEVQRDEFHRSLDRRRYGLQDDEYVYLVRRPHSSNAGDS
jgi:ubiquinone/menaquinone biosynthesis C-methylase UbiE